MNYQGEAEFTHGGINWVASYEACDGEVILNGLFLLSDPGSNDLLDHVCTALEEVAQAEVERAAVDHAVAVAEAREDW